MPGGDGTGPRGKGPMTGRELGRCDSATDKGSRQGGRGGGRGFRGGRGWGAGRGGGWGRRNQAGGTQGAGWLENFEPAIDDAVSLDALMGQTRSIIQAMQSLLARVERLETNLPEPPLENKERNPETEEEQS